MEEGREYIDSTIKLIEEGKKYRKIVDELKQYCLILERQNVLKEIIRLKQKYFSETVKKTITFTIEAKTNDKLGEAINDFEMFWAGYNETKGHCIKYGYGKEGD